MGLNFDFVNNVTSLSNGTLIANDLAHGRTEPSFYFKSGTTFLKAIDVKGGEVSISEENAKKYGTPMPREVLAAAAAAESTINLREPKSIQPKSPKHRLNETVPCMRGFYDGEMHDATKVRFCQLAKMQLKPSETPTFVDPIEMWLANKLLDEAYSISMGTVDTSKLYELDQLALKDSRLDSMTADEQAVFKHIIKQFHDRLERYHLLAFYAQRANWTNPKEPSEFWGKVREARESGWFDMGDPTEEEIKYCGDLPTGAPVINVDMPGSRKAETIKMDGVGDPMIEGALTISADDVKMLVVNSLAGAGFGLDFLAKFISPVFEAVRGDMVKGIIDAIGGLFKGYVVGNPAKVNKALKGIPSKLILDGSIMAIDGMADFIKAAVRHLDELTDSTGNGDAISQSEAVNSIIEDVKQYSDVLTSEQFMALIRQLIKEEEVRHANDNRPDVNGTYDDLESKYAPDPKKQEAITLLPAPKKTGKKGKQPDAIEVSYVETDQQVEQPAAMGSMTLAQAFPELARRLDPPDDGKPAFCDPSLTVTRGIQGAKPSIVGALQPGELTPPADDQQIVHNVARGMMNMFPWLSQLMQVAANNHVAVTVEPVQKFMGKNEKQEDVFEVIALRISSWYGSQYSYLKSFTIDLGHVLDSRIKIFFNVNSSGFHYPEECESAWRLFTNDGKGLELQFLDKIFREGHNALTDADAKSFRCYASNTFAINRFIDYATVPTGKVKRENRQWVRDIAYKLYYYIKEVQQLNNISLGRFQVVKFNPTTLDMTLSNYGVTWRDRQLNAPNVSIEAHVCRDKKNRVKLDNKKRPCIDIVISYADNVFPSGLKVPNGATAGPNVLTPPPAAEPQPVAAADEEGETPSILKGEGVGPHEETENVDVLKGGVTGTFEIPEEAAPAATV